MAVLMWDTSVPAEASKNGIKEKQQALEEELQALKKIIGSTEQDLQEEHEKELQHLKESFNHILRNEQVRTSHMLREAYNDRQEKIAMLQMQLQCANQAALMYVLCAERRRSKIEVARIREEYSKYIKTLEDILAESQTLILNLARGYKTAARVDDEWREKMKSIIKEFHSFIYNFAGGYADVNQYFLDVPELLKIKAPVHIDPDEEPDFDEIDAKQPGEQEQETPDPSEKLWWQRLDEDCHPFVVYGDMSEFNPSQRLQVLKTLKNKTVPRKWKEYAFHDMFLGEKCENLDLIKDKYNYTRHKPLEANWESIQSDNKQPTESRHKRSVSIDFRGAMGSIVKMIASNATSRIDHTSLLAAKDSFEIVSATRLLILAGTTGEVLLAHITSVWCLTRKHTFEQTREKRGRSNDYSDHLKLNIRNKVDALFSQKEESLREEETSISGETSEKLVNVEENDESVESTVLKLEHKDSMRLIPSHVTDVDHVIHFGKMCPEEKCRLKSVDEFMDSLPPYMRASPFVHYEKSYEHYEACTEEQLSVLEKTIEERKKKEKVDFGMIQENPMKEWTSELLVPRETTGPPCCCNTPNPTPVNSKQHVFTLVDINPVKEKVDAIKKEFFFSDKIDFNRFEVIGESNQRTSPIAEDKNKLVEVTEILNAHPSLFGLFEDNVPC